MKNNKNIPSDEHPFVIFYDDYEDCYYFLKARGATYFNYENKKIETKVKYDGEILVYESTNEGLFKKPSYVDCSQIAVFLFDYNNLNIILGLL